MFYLFKKLSSNIPPNPPFRKGENERSLFEKGRFLKEYFGLSHAMVIALVLFIAISIFGAIAGRPPKRRQLTKAPLLWAKLDGSLADENGSGSTFAYSAGKSSSGSDYGITLKEGDNIQYGPGAAIDAGSDVYENWNPNQGTMNVWVEPSWSGNDNEAHWIWSADSGRIDTADANLVAYWKFDEGSENFASDSSSNSNVGYLHGPALSFDGGDYVLSLGSGESLDISSAFTISAWIKVNNINAQHHVISKIISPPNAIAYCPYFLRVHDDNSIMFYASADLATWGTDLQGGSVVANTWYHIMVTHDGASAILYQNGSQVDIDGTPANPSISEVYSTFIGGRNNYFLNGQIDEVRIYNRALSATEVGQHYVGTFADESGLVGYWDMDDGQGQTVADSSGNSNDGTRGANDDEGGDSADPTWVNYAPRWTDEGRFGDAVVFDGSDDYVVATSTAQMNFAAADDFSIGGWFKHNTISTSADYILTKYANGTAGGYKVYMDSDGDIVFAVDDDGTWTPDDIAGDDQSANYDDNSWHYFLAQKDGTTGIYIYVDGVLVDSDTTIASTGTLSNATSTFIGIDCDGSTGSWDGYLDSITVYNDLLTSQEIADHYSRGNLYKDENNNLKFEIGGLNLSYDISDWSANSWHMITALWNPDGINQVSGSDMLYGNLFVDGVSAASSSTSFTSASSTPSTFYFAQDSYNNGQFGGTVYGLQVDENNWKAADITTAYNSGTGIAPVASGKTNFTLSTASSTDVVAWQHSGSLANDGNFEDGDAADWAQPSEGNNIVTNGTFDTDSGWTKEAGWTISGGTANADGTTSGRIYQNVGLASNKTYKISFNWTRTSGSLYPEYYNTDYRQITGITSGTSGTFSGYFNATNITTPYIYFRQLSTFVGTIDEVLIVEAQVISAQGNIVTNEQNLVGGWNFETAGDSADATDVTGNNDLTWTNITSADYVEGKFGSAIDFNGTDEYLSQTNVYTQADDDGEVSGVLTDGSATIVINDASNLSTAYDLSAGVNNYMIVMTDSASQVAWGYLGTNSFSTPNNTYEIYSTRTGSTQNYAAKGTFSFSNTPITYQIRRSDFQVTGALTLGAWVKISSSDASTYLYLIAKGNGTPNGYELSVYNGKGRFESYNNYPTGYVNVLDTAINLRDSNFHFLVGTYNGSTGKVYIDGNLVKSVDDADGIGDDYKNFRIGSKQGSYNFNGLVDSPFIYSRALGADEIRGMYERGYSDHYGAKIRLSADDAQTYINSNASLSNGGNYLLSFDYRLGEENINPINFTIRDGSGENTAEKNLLGSSVTGLVGAWNFEEGTGSSAVMDVSGNGYTGTISATPAGTNTTATDMWSGGVSGKFGRAVEFDGTDDCITAGDVDLPTSGGFTLSAWIYPNSNSWRTILGKKYDATNNGYDFKLYSGYYRLSFGDGSDSYIITATSGTISNSTWTHVLVTYDYNNVEFYKNGILVDSQESTASLSNNNETLRIGRYVSPTPNYAFNGLIDSVRIYNRALSPEEVYESYKKGLWHKYEISFEADEAATHLFRFIQNGSTSGDSILYVDNFDLQTNLVDNGGMEGTYTDGIPAGWSNSGLEAGEGAEETTTYRTGAKAFKLNSADVDEGITQTVTVANGSWYTFSGWAKNNNQDLKVVLSGAIEDTIDLTTSNNNWTKFNKSYKSNSTNLTIAILSGAADQTGYFDDFSVVAIGSNSATVAASSAAFTPNFGYRPGKVSGENALPITLSDNLQFDEGGKMGTGSAELAYENFDPFGGTIKTWVKPHWDGTDTGTHVILEDKNGTDYFKLYYSNGNLYFDVYVSSTTYRTYQSVSSWTAGTWYHVTATWSNQNTVNADATGYISNLYVNGSDSGNTYSNVTAGTNFWTAFAPGTIYIGESSTPDSRWNGMLEGLSILNSPLSESEVSADYNSGSGVALVVETQNLASLPANSSDPDGMVRWHLKNYREVTANESGLVGGWNFESAATDVTGTYTGTWTGSAAYVAGKNGNAADFDGSTDYVDLGDIGF